MLRRMLLGLALAMVLISGGLSIACSQNDTKPAALTGEEAHERHATGIDSQVNDK